MHQLIIIPALKSNTTSSLAHGDGDLLAITQRDHQRAALRGVVDARADGDRFAFGDGFWGAQGDGGSVGVVADGDAGFIRGINGFVATARGRFDTNRDCAITLQVSVVWTAVEGHATSGFTDSDNNLLTVAERNHQRSTLRCTVDAC